MSSRVTKWVAVSTAALLAVTLAGVVPAEAGGSHSTANPQIQQQEQFVPMQAMGKMGVRMMNDAMHGHGTTAGGMMVGGTMSGG